MSAPVLMAALTGFAFLAAAFVLAPRAHAQVFSSQPYVAAPDPAVEQLRQRVEQLEGRPAQGDRPRRELWAPSSAMPAASPTKPMPAARRPRRTSQR